jgi:hypothetical protein
MVPSAMLELRKGRSEGFNISSLNECSIKVIIVQSFQLKSIQPVVWHLELELVEPTERGAHVKKGWLKFY